MSNAGKCKLRDIHGVFKKPFSQLSPFTKTLTISVYHNPHYHFWTHIIYNWIYHLSTNLLLLSFCKLELKMSPPHFTRMAKCNLSAGCLNTTITFTKLQNFTVIFYQDSLHQLLLLKVPLSHHNCHHVLVMYTHKWLELTKIATVQKMWM